VNQRPNYTTAIEYVDYPRNEYPTELITQLVNKGICKISKDKIKFIATGVLIYRNKFIIIFPKAYNIPKYEGNILEHIQVLFQVLLKYSAMANLSPEEMDLLGGKNGQQDENLYTAYRLIQDFTDNGLLMKEIKEKSLSLSGKTDWPATINKMQPIFSGRSVIYTESISRKSTIDRQNRLYLLHKYCIYKSVERYGWLFGLTVENINLEEVELDFDIPYGVNFLTSELNSTFVERELNVIKMMIDFLGGIESENSEENLETLITPYFQNVWEYICSYNFKNQYNNLKSIIPKLNWEIESNAPVQNQRPDIMVMKEKQLYILDAKYYNIESNLPGWPDVVKQLFYAFTIFKNIKSENFKLTNKRLESKLKNLEGVENIFLFPSGDIDPVKYIGRVNIENNSDFDDIKACKVNTFLSMKCFIEKEKFNFINRLS
jgi:hypothetical protein